VLELSPASSVISLVVPEGSVADCRRSSFCDHGHFFATAEAGAAWLANHSNGVVLPVADAHRLGRLLAGHRAMRAQSS
jgi:alkylmercury lyase